MADIQLNKPLYKSEDDKEFTPPIPRQPKASLLGRAAAVFLDVMLLHLFFGAIVRFVPAIPLTLGPLAPWLGLALGFLYFTVGFSHITLGRTFGKLITRVQVSDIAGPDLPMSRAFLRAALLLWPLPVHLVLRMVAERFANSDPTSIYVTIEVLGTMLIIGWVLGNLGFASFDPFSRTVYDRIAKSIVINAELEPEPTAAHLAAARAADAQPPLKRSITALGFALAICMAFGVASAFTGMQQLRDLTDEERARARSLVVEGFGRAVPAAPLDDSETTGIPAISFQFRKRGFVDVEEVKNDPRTSETLNRLIAATTGPEFFEDAQKYMSAYNLERGKKGEPPVAMPETMEFELSFVEYADMFFAKEAHPVYTLSREVDMPTTATVAADDRTTGQN